MNSETIDIVIVNYNTEVLLQSCIQAIHKFSKGINYQLIVIDNASVKPPRVTAGTIFVQNNENIGLAKAWNQAIRLGSGKYILFLNPDVLVTPRWLEKLLSYVGIEDKVGMVGCKHVNRQGKIVHAGLDFDGSYRYKGKKANKFGIKPTLCLSVSGGCFLIKRENLAQLGLFDPNYFLYYEETDYAMNVWIKGYKVLYCPVSVMHDSHGSPISAVKRKKYISESRRYFRAKWYLSL